MAQQIEDKIEQKNIAAKIGEWKIKMIIDKLASWDHKEQQE